MTFFDQYFLYTCIIVYECIFRKIFIRQIAKVLVKVALIIIFYLVVFCTTFFAYI